MIQIIKLVAESQNVALSPDALKLFGEISTNASLRFCIQLLTPAKMIAQIQQCNLVTAEHLQQADDLYMDAKTSAQRVAQEAHLFIS